MKIKNRIHRIKSFLCLAAALGTSFAGSEAQTNGTVLAWGNNYYGQTNVPAGLSNVLALGGGYGHSLALTSDGTVVAWGDNDFGQSDIPAGLSGVTAIAAGWRHNLVIMSDGTVFAWGDNRSGQTDVPSDLSGVIAIAAGGSHSLALKSDGTVAAWGSLEFGQGRVPSGLSGVIAIAAGGNHSLALKADRTVVAWGAGEPGQIGTTHRGQSTVPSGLSGVFAIAAGSYHSLAIRGDGTVAAWGAGQSSSTYDWPNYRQSFVPSGLSGVIAIAAGGLHNLAHKSDGTVVAWGYNDSGQSTVPAGQGGVVAVGAGTHHSLALLGSCPMVVAGPAGQTAGAGSTVVFRAVAAGKWPLHYRWFFNSTQEIPGANNPLLQLTNVQVAQSGAYAVFVNNPCGIVWSTSAMLSVTGVLPTIVTQPTYQAVRAGLSAEFLVVAAGSPPLSYQWFFDSTNPIAGAVGSALQLTNVQPAQAGDYTVIVTNVFGAVTSAPASLSVTAVPPTIITPPSNQVAWVGFTADFSVVADGSPPLAYQWRFNEIDSLAGATGSVLQLTDLQPWQAGGYTVVVTNAFGAVTSPPAMLSFVPPETVPYCTETALRLAMAAGGSITFACDGTITLANTITNETHTVLDGTGHQVTISGGNNVRVFYVNSNVTFTVRNLTIANGSSIKGAGIFNDGGTVNLVGVTLASNQAIGFQYRGTELVPFGAAEGGGIFNQAGAVSAVSCVFSNNSALQSLGPNGGPPAVPPYYWQAFGGAIGNAGGVINLQDCLLAGNTASGSPGRTGNNLEPDYPVWLRGLDGLGGAIHSSGNLTVIRCSFLRNSASGGAGASYYLTSSSQPILPGGSGGSGTGGAICNLGSLTISHSTFASNSVTGGGGAGGAHGYDPPPTHSPRGPGGPAGAGGNALGSALFMPQGAVSVVNSTFAWNTGAAGSGGAGGPGADAYYNNTSGTDGGAGANGGSVAGAIIGMPNLTNCSLAFNSAIYGPGGAGGRGGTGRGIGADGIPGANGINGAAGGGGLNGGSCVNTLLAANLPGGNGSGPITDLGHNLSSDASCNFTNVGSLNNTNPRLGPLANNGGPTLTMALLGGSPAIDAGDDASAPPTDQRGFPRPVGVGADIGAYEYGHPAALRILPARDGDVGIIVYGISGQTCWLLSSTNLADWRSVATNQIGPNGTTLFLQSCGTGETQRFFRVAIP